MSKIYTANSFIVTGGTNAQFLKGDGTLDSSVYYLASNPSGYITGANVAYKNINNNFTSSQNITGFLDVSTELRIGGVNINSANTLTNVAYRNQNNTFSVSQTITGTLTVTGGNSTQWNDAYANRIASLTSTGNSGAATLVSNVLNIPNYTLAGLGGQPLDADLTAIAALAGTSGLLKKTAANTWTLDTNSYALTSALHSAVTLGTANGLSLSGQQISLGLASATLNGALSSTDWNTFNNKQPAGNYEPAFSKNTAFNKNFGTLVGTVAEGNDSRINNGQTAFGWGNHALAGYLTTQTDSQTLTWTDATNTLAISNGNSVIISGFADSVHTHAIGDVTGLQTALDGKSAVGHLHTGVYQPAGTYDNYVSWNLKTNGVQRIAIVKDGTLDIVGGTFITATYSAGGVVTLANSMTNLSQLSTRNYSDLNNIPTTFAPSAHVLASHGASTLAQLNNIVSDATLIDTNDARLSNARIASDVYAWAKAATKPTYTYSEVGAEQAFTKNTAFNKNFGTTAGTVAEGNDSRINNGQTAFGWGNHSGLYSLLNHTHTFASLTSKPTTLAGYGITDASLNTHTHAYLPLAGGTLTSANFSILNLTRSSINGSNMNFNNSNGLLGRVGFLGDGAFAITNGAEGQYNLLHISSSGGATFSGTVSALGGNSTNWNTAYGWGNHAGLYSLLNHTHTFASLTAKPTTLSGFGITDAASKLYVHSRGQNLVTNGSAFLGDNTNFSTFIFDGANANYSAGSFKHVGTGTKLIDELIPVDVTKTYKISVDAKSLLETGRYYAFVDMYDVDNLQINATQHMYRANTQTTLAQPLNTGDTVMYLTSAANWDNSGTAEVSTHLRSIIFWNYSNSFGYLYPPETYSRNWYGNAWDPGAINFTNNTITLKIPWNWGNIPAGTILSNGSAGGTYKYWPTIGYTLLPTTWYNFSTIISGVDLSGQNQFKFSPGTAKIKIGWLMDYTNTGDTSWWTNLKVTEDYSTDLRFTSTVATGTAPFTVASTTAVTNLNADLLDGQHGSYYQAVGATHYVGTTLIANNRASAAQTLTGVSIDGNASTATALTTAYAGGQQVNPQVYFNNTVGLKVAMTGATSVWSDTLWINGYSGGDVLSMCALHTLRNSQPRMYITAQQSTATAYGTPYEFVTTYNTGILGIWTSATLTNLNQLTTRNYSDLQNKPTTIAGYGITDAYVSWNLKTNGVQRTGMASGSSLDIVAGTNMSVTYGAGGVVTLASVGGAEGATAKHVQSVASTTWTFPHGTGELYPVITVYGSTGAVIVPETIQATDVNTITLTFPVAITGVATAVVGGAGTQGIEGPEGPAGRGISTIIRTTGTGAPGTTDIYTITYTDATTSTFNVYNGANGVGDMQKLVYDTNNNGIVDNSALVNGLTVLTAVPAGALFTDTIYTLPFADNSANWNTAYSWGNHAGLYSLVSHNHAGVYQPAGTYDNYVSWNLKTNGVQRTTIASGGNLDLVAGSNITLSYGAGGVVTIAGSAGGVTVHSGLTLDDGTNPHGTTKSDVSLGNVDNTSDANKPVSTAQATAIGLKEDDLGNPSTNGYILSSTTAGVRSWIAPGAGGGLSADSVGVNELKPELKNASAIADSVIQPRGDAVYDTPGTYSWVCPAGVTSVSVLAIGGGGGGNQYSSNNVGGAGGGLGWKNNITVVPGNSYTVVVGDGGIKGVYGTGAADSGGDSYFINTSTVKGGGGVGGQYNVTQTAGGNYVGDGGGNGGYVSGLNTYCTGGGGAGGYSGAGGSPSTGTYGSGSAGTGGAGGGGGNGGSVDTGSGGGGTGIFGEGANGAGGTGSTNDAITGGGGGSGGTDGGIWNTVTIQARGGLYGGGGGSSDTSGNENGAGGSGAVRIVWGTGRSFPSTDVNTTGDESTYSYDFDWSEGIQFNLVTMTGDSTFTFSNLLKGKTITIPLTGDFVPTFPVDIDMTTYDGTKVNYLQVYCADSVTPVFLSGLTIKL